MTTFFVYTKDKADQIVDIQNGFLGWHYVNKVDTCIYFSDSFSFDMGNQTISWDGKDQDENKVPAGEYTYYLWAYDHQSPKQKVCYFEDAIYPYQAGGTHIEEWEENGEPLANPWIHTAYKKWVIGNDPVDATLQETTNINYPSGWRLVRTSSFDPTDHEYFYITTHNKETSSQKVQKYQWVPNGDSVLQENWGTDLVFTNPHYGGSGPATNRDVLYATYYSQYENGSNVNFYTIDYDGTLIQEFDMSDWFTRLEDYEKGAQASGGPRTMVVRDGYAFIQHFGSCIKAMVNPVAEDAEDFFTWVNQNGDYISDTNYAPDATYPWVCCN